MKKRALADARGVKRARGAEETRLLVLAQTAEPETVCAVVAEAAPELALACVLVCRARVPLGAGRLREALTRFRNADAAFPHDALAALRRCSDFDEEEKTALLVALLLPLADMLPEDEFIAQLVRIAPADISVMLETLCADMIALLSRRLFTPLWTILLNKHLAEPDSACEDGPAPACVEAYYSRLVDWPVGANTYRAWEAADDVAAFQHWQDAAQSTACVFLSYLASQNRTHDQKLSSLLAIFQELTSAKTVRRWPLAFHMAEQLTHAVLAGAQDATHSSLVKLCVEALPEIYALVQAQIVERIDPLANGHGVFDSHHSRNHKRNLYDGLCFQCLAPATEDRPLKVSCRVCDSLQAHEDCVGTSATPWVCEPCGDHDLAWDVGRAILDRWRMCFAEKVRMGAYERQLPSDALCLSIDDIHSFELWPAFVLVYALQLSSEAFNKPVLRGFVMHEYLASEPEDVATESSGVEVQIDIASAGSSESNLKVTDTGGRERVTPDAAADELLRFTMIYLRSSADHRLLNEGLLKRASQESIVRLMYRFCDCSGMVRKRLQALNEKILQLVSQKFLKNSGSAKCPSSWLLAYSNMPATDSEQDLKSKLAVLVGPYRVMEVKKNVLRSLCRLDHTPASPVCTTTLTARYVLHRTCRALQPSKGLADQRLVHAMLKMVCTNDRLAQDCAKWVSLRLELCRHLCSYYDYVNDDGHGAINSLQWLIDKTLLKLNHMELLDSAPVKHVVEFWRRSSLFRGGGDLIRFSVHLSAFCVYCVKEEMCFISKEGTPLDALSCIIRDELLPGALKNLIQCLLSSDQQASESAAEIQIGIIKVLTVLGVAYPITHPALRSVIPWLLLHIYKAEEFVANQDTPPSVIEIAVINAILELLLKLPTTVWIRSIGDNLKRFQLCLVHLSRTRSASINIAHNSISLLMLTLKSDMVPMMLNALLGASELNRLCQNALDGHRLPYTCMKIKTLMPYIAAENLIQENKFDANRVFSYLVGSLEDPNVDNRPVRIRTIGAILKYCSVHDERIFRILEERVTGVNQDVGELVAYYDSYRDIMELVTSGQSASTTPNTYNLQAIKFLVATASSLIASHRSGELHKAIAEFTQEVVGLVPTSALLDHLLLLLVVEEKVNKSKLLALMHSLPDLQGSLNRRMYRFVGHSLTYMRLTHDVPQVTAGQEAAPSVVKLGVEERFYDMFRHIHLLPGTKQVLKCVVGCASKVVSAEATSDVMLNAVHLCNILVTWRYQDPSLTVLVAEELQRQASSVLENVENPVTAAVGVVTLVTCWMQLQGKMSELKDWKEVVLNQHLHTVFGSSWPISNEIMLDPITAACSALVFPLTSIITIGTSVGILSHQLYEWYFPPAQSSVLMSGPGLLALVGLSLLGISLFNKTDSCEGRFCPTCTRCQSGRHDVLDAFDPRVKVNPDAPSPMPQYGTDFRPLEQS